MHELTYLALDDDDYERSGYELGTIEVESEIIQYDLDEDEDFEGSDELVQPLLPLTPEGPPAAENVDAALSADDLPPQAGDAPTPKKPAARAPVQKQPRPRKTQATQKKAAKSTPLKKAVASKKPAGKAPAKKVVSKRQPARKAVAGTATKKTTAAVAVKKQAAKRPAGKKATKGASKKPTAKRKRR